MSNCQNNSVKYKQNKGKFSAGRSDLKTSFNPCT